MAPTSSGRLFVLPQTAVLTTVRDDPSYNASATTYSHYNYLGNGMIARLKRQRFETALRLARPYFGSAAIDMGCADGILLPSLAKHFSHVAGIDTNPQFVQIASEVAASLDLSNVETHCNKGVGFPALREILGARPYQVMFLLETLEHIGDRERLYASKAEFLDNCFSLLAPDGVVIASVPRMVGPLFLAKYALQWALRRVDERHSLAELWQAGVRYDTSGLERRWAGGHVGFNHLRLDEVLRERFDLRQRRLTPTSVFYVLARRNAPVGT